jgi:dihydroorotate dehydrogenase
MIKNAVLLSDFAVINLSSYNSSSIYQYKDMNKLQSLIDKIKEEVYYNIGLKSAIQHELLFKPKEDDLSVTKNFRYSIALIMKGRTRIFLRLDTNISDEELKNIINLTKNNKIIDGLVIGGMTNLKQNQFMCGEKNKEISVQLLKKSFEFSNGEISLISTGGILSGDDVYDRLKCGADFVLIFSPFLIQGPYCLEKIIDQLRNRMELEGKNSIREIKL